MEDREKRLPKWAQDELRRVRQQRNAAVNALNNFVDSQEATAFFYEESPLTGETAGPVVKRRYIDTYRVSVRFGKVNLTVSTNGWRRDVDPEIRLQWSAEDRMTADNVAMIPDSHNCIRLVHRDHMSKW